MKALLLSLFTIGSLTAATAAEPCEATRRRSSVPVAHKADIVKTAAAAGQFKTLLSLLIAADLDDALKGDGPFTVFAPTDEAFAKLPKGTVEKLLKPENKDLLRSILTYHIVPDKASFAFEVAKVEEPYEFKTLNGNRLRIVKGDGTLRVNDAKILSANIACRNGSVQIIDSVLMPSENKNTIPAVAEKAGLFKTLLAAVTAAEIAEVLSGDGPFTVFAPTDDAFAKLPKGTVEKLLKPENRKQLVGLLKYHVVAGKLTAKDLVKADQSKTLQGGSVKFGITDGRLTIDQSNVIRSDVMADNGIIQVIDRVLTPSH